MVGSGAQEWRLKRGAQEWGLVRWLRPPMVTVHFGKEERRKRQLKYNIMLT